MLKPYGDRILVNNGLVCFEVDSLSGNKAECTVITGGELSNQKSMSFPGKVLKQDFLSEQDKNDIRFGIDNDIDYIQHTSFAGEMPACLKQITRRNDHLWRVWRHRLRSRSCTAPCTWRTGTCRPAG